jgi:hypothetical protein
VYEAPLTTALAIAPSNAGHSPEQFPRRVAHELLPGKFEQIFGSRIHVGDTSIGTQHQHRGRQQIQPGVGCRRDRCRRREEAQLHAHGKDQCAVATAPACAVPKIGSNIRAAIGSTFIVGKAKALPDIQSG